MFIYEKLCSFLHFRTRYFSNFIFELIKTKENQEKPLYLIFLFNVIVVCGRNKNNTCIKAGVFL
jgi:hypothetical protein